MLRADVLSLAEWLRDAESALAAAGCASARNDAELLAAYGLGVRWGELWSRIGDPVDPSVLARLDQLVARRCSGEPLAYITRSVVFFGIELECGPGVLVPRPETETLVDVALELVSGRAEPVVADIGTGSGAIAIAIGHRRPDARIWATDVSDAALTFAERNAARAHVKLTRASGDLYDALAGSLCGRVDLVVSNPPYVPEEAELPADVSAEPREALFAGPRGDEVLLRLVAAAPHWIADGGALAVEVGTADQAARVLAGLGGFGNAGIREDHNGCPRVVWARR